MLSAISAATRGSTCRGKRGEGGESGEKGRETGSNTRGKTEGGMRRGAVDDIVGDVCCYQRLDLCTREGRVRVGEKGVRKGVRRVQHREGGREGDEAWRRRRCCRRCGLLLEARPRKGEGGNDPRPNLL